MDPFLPLALGVRATKGGYAVLLGSGISRAAGIPTGWEVIEDLIRQLDVVREEDCEPDPAAWFQSVLNEQPDYGQLVEAVAGTPTERRQLLRRYFEPTPEEREEGLKLPTPAHRAVAELMQRGYVRVVVTTNFDHLLEDALAALGVNPTVVSTADATEGVMPLVHVEHLIIKVHGDYLDTRIKNTPDELASYDSRVDGLLNRVLDEFGLIVCGWSAEWDGALRGALERCATHRFTTYWSALTQPTEVANRLIQLRRAQVLSGVSADEFFSRLCQTVVALEQVSRAHPLSPKVAVATLKRYLPDQRSFIALHDFVTNEARAVQQGLSDSAMPANVPFDVGEVVRRVERGEALAEITLAIMATGCFWGGSEHRGVWVKALEMVGNPPRRSPGPGGWEQLARYPALLLLYAGGVAAVAANNYDTLLTLFRDAAISDGSSEQRAGYALNTWAIIEDDRMQQQLPGMETHLTPLSERIYQIVREPLREILPQDRRYEQAFDRFEYLLALTHSELLAGGGHTDEDWGPVGCFLWRRSAANLIGQEIDSHGAAWLPLRAGFFGGSLERLSERRTAFEAFLSTLRRNHGISLR